MITYEQLTGQGPSISVQLQARLPVEALQLMAKLALAALKTIPQERKVQPSYTQIRQVKEELYMAFIDRLREALDKVLTRTRNQHC